MLVEGHLLVGANKMFVDDLKGGLDHLDRAIAIGATLPPHAFSSPRRGQRPKGRMFYNLRDHLVAAGLSGASRRTHE